MGDVTKLNPKQTQCDYCPESHPWQHCPRLAAIEYYDNGSRFRVDFVLDPIIEFEFDDDDTTEDE